MNEGEFGPNSPRATDNMKYKKSDTWDTVKKLTLAPEGAGHVCLKFGESASEELGEEFATMSSEFQMTHVCRAMGTCAELGRIVLLPLQQNHW